MVQSDEVLKAGRFSGLELSQKKNKKGEEEGKERFCYDFQCHYQMISWSYNADVLRAFKTHNSCGNKKGCP